MSAAQADIPIDELLADLGLTGVAAGEARRALEDEGLTNPRKQRIALGKKPRVREVVDGRWQRLCHNCRARAAGDARPVVIVPQATCSLCAGSNNARAVETMTEACRRAGITKLLIVGGSPTFRRELADLAGGQLELRLVDGTRAVGKQAAQQDITWADLVVVLGGTELAHKVSTLYTREPGARRKLVTTSRRGIEAIADDITRCDVVTGARGAH